MNGTTALQILLTLFSLIAILYAAIKYIEQQIDKKLASPETLAKISKLFRPSMIFDNSESVISDQGAMNFIQSIKIEYHKNEKELPSKIIVDFNKFISLPPLLTSLDGYAYNETVERGKGFEWVYNLEPIYSQSEPIKYRFRLEILQ